jgi:hypothetical protein
MTPRSTWPAATGCPTTEPASASGYALDIFIDITTDIGDLSLLAPLVAQLRDFLYRYRFLSDEESRPYALRYTFNIAPTTRSGLRRQLAEPAKRSGIDDSSRRTPAPRTTGRRRPSRQHGHSPTPFLTGLDGSLCFTGTPANEFERALRDRLLAHYGLSTPTTQK